MADLEFRFPEAFLEIGKDDDHSYMSLRTKRQSDGRLKIDVERWGIIQHGLLLSVQPGAIFKLNIIGRCGTVSTRTWQRASFSRVMEKEEEDKAQQIEYAGGAPVEIGQIDIKFRLSKQAYQKS